MARGDHIKVSRRLYTHHGIDVGDGTVIHFTGEPLRPRGARIVRSDMATFLAGGTARVVVYRGQHRPAGAVIAAAEAQLAAGNYCMFRNNCEHFATFCKTGNTKSRQVRRVAVIGAAFTSVVLYTGASVVRGMIRRHSVRERA